MTLRKKINESNFLCGKYQQLKHYSFSNKKKLFRKCLVNKHKKNYLSRFGDEIRVLSIFCLSSSKNIFVITISPVDNV